jgi:hypothetical protein
MKKWLLILMAVVAFGCGDGSRSNSGSEDEETGTTSSEERDEGELNDENDLYNEDQMTTPDTTGQMQTDTVGTSSSESAPAKSGDRHHDKTEKDY